MLSGREVRMGCNPLCATITRPRATNVSEIVVYSGLYKWTA